MKEERDLFQSYLKFLKTFRFESMMPEEPYE